ncbi:unnamed protein product [Caenorhabditis angaria]|uniref:PPM-type phosphatase domain-containing protein n=1 Tax=Caenorhabditis angaria TaxID=860376 RepID=A0A9P1N403_9PELO|nr:unnamed protein product [Caenorhabditis angaria]
MEIAARVVSSVVNRASTSQNAPKSSVGMVVDVSDSAFIGGFIPSIIDKQKYPYSRPEFLFFTEDDINLSSDHTIRPIITPKHPEKMPLFAGYAEVINAGKSKLNEDQASARMLNLVQGARDAEKTERSREVREDDDLLTPGTDSDSSQLCVSRIEAALFSLYDGHAGPSAAVVAAKCYHEHLKSRLAKVIDAVITLDKQETQTFSARRSESSYSFKAEAEAEGVRSEQLVCGALETSFIDMDEQIGDDKQVWRLPGGCAAISVLVLLGKLYVANAGDCRAVLTTSSRGSRALSRDQNPGSERKRLQELAYQCPELLGNAFSRLEYSRRLTRRDLNSQVLYRDWFMDGWATKTVKESDLKPPLISENSRKRRLLNTIGVSRGFGDHHLLTVDDRLSIKPFLSAVPEITVTDLRDLDVLTDKDVVIVASDGLWDVISNEDAGLIVRSVLGSSDPTDPARYTLAAQELVQAARGMAEAANRWVLASGGHASGDDITVFIIPLKYCAAPPTNFEDDDDDEEMINLE